jgi:hypothetical protein
MSYLQSAPPWLGLTSLAPEAQEANSQETGAQEKDGGWQGHTKGKGHAVYTRKTGVMGVAETSV